MGKLERTDGIDKKGRILHWHAISESEPIRMSSSQGQPRFSLLTDAPRARHTPLDGSRESLQVRELLPLSVPVCYARGLARGRS